MARIQLVGVQLVGDVAQVGFQRELVEIKLVLGHQVSRDPAGHVERGWRVGRVGHLPTTEIQATTDAQFGRELVGCPCCAGVNGDQARARVERGGSLPGGLVDVGHWQPHVGAKYLPLGRDAARDVEFETRHMAFARQGGQVDQRVGVALVQFGAAEHGVARGPLAVSRVDLGPELDVDGLLGRRVDVGGVERIGLAGRVERIGRAEVEAGQRRGLVQHANAFAHFRHLHAVAGGGEGAGRCGGQGMGGVVTREVVVAQPGQNFPVRSHLHQVLHVQTVRL